MHALSILAAAGLAAAQGVTFTPTTFSTMTYSDVPKPISSSSYATTLSYNVTLEPTSTSMPEKPPTLPTLVSGSHSGSGCPQGSFKFPGNANINDTVFSLPKFDLNTSGGIMNKTKNCEIHLNFANMPAGWQFAVSEVLLSGLEYNLQEGAKLRIWFDTFFSTNYPVRNTEQFEIDVNGVTYVVLSIGEKNMLWSTCGGSDIINMDLRVMIDDSAGNKTVGGNSTFGTKPLLERFTYTWKQCSNGTDSEGSLTTDATTGPGVTMTETATDSAAPTKTSDSGDDRSEAEEPSDTETMTDEAPTTSTSKPKQTDKPSATSTQSVSPKPTADPEECEAEDPEESQAP